MLPLQEPEAVQEVALVALQMRTEDSLKLMVVGVAEKFKVGAGVDEPTV